MFADPEIEALIGGAVPAAEPSAPQVAPSSIGGAGGELSMVGAFDGASRFDRSVAMWSPALRSADLDLLPDKTTADARVRDMLRNDAYVLGGERIHRDNIVGSQFVLNAKPEHIVLGLDETWAEEFQAEVEAKFGLWAESSNNWPDAARMNTLTSLVRLAVGVYTAAGEVLASVEWIKDGRPFNTAIQMIDLDRLSNPDIQMDDQFLRGGVKRDRYGAPQGYYIRTHHPADYVVPAATEWKYVPARKPWGRVQMIHIMEQMRPDQSRGVSDMVAALKEIFASRKFRDVVLQNAVINATYAASIESDLPTEAVFAQLGGGNMDDIGNAITKYASGYLNAISKYAGSSKNMHLDGAKIPHFFPGTRLNLQSAGTPGGIGTGFEQSLLRYIASSLGVSYEQLSRDYTQTNYSSARASMNETWKYMQSRKKLVADRFASTIYRLWLEEAINKKQITSLPRNAPNWYDGLNADAYSQCDWIGASRGQIDELKETQAAVLRIQNGLSTQEDETARFGKDWRKVNAQRQREKKDAEARGLVIEQSNMMNAASGSPKDKTDPKAGTQESNDE